MSHREDALSRGHLVAEYLKEEPDPQAYLGSVQSRADQYNGFNVLVGTPGHAYYFSNRDGTPRRVDPGIHGMSNAQLDDPWPKVERGTTGLQEVLAGTPTPDQLLDILADRDPAPIDQLPDTGVGEETERMLSPPFIESESYGTRCSTVILIHRSGTVTFVERNFDRGTPTDTRRFSFELESRSVA
jgi:uncharacterized protein with NRDE domain